MKTTKIAPGIYQARVNGIELKIKNIITSRGSRWVVEYTKDGVFNPADDIYFTKSAAILGAEELVTYLTK